MKYRRLYPFFSLLLVTLLLIGTNVNLVQSQSRRQPPTTNEKKNKRPTDTKDGEKKDEGVIDAEYVDVDDKK